MRGHTAAGAQDPASCGDRGKVWATGQRLFDCSAAQCKISSVRFPAGIFPGWSAAAPAAVAAGETAVNSPMPGNIFKVECSVGQAVKAGDVLVVLEAMKMEIEVSAPVDGTVKAVAATVGTAVNTDDLLVTLG